MAFPHLDIVAVSSNQEIRPAGDGVQITDLVLGHDVARLGDLCLRRSRYLVRFPIALRDVFPSLLRKAGAKSSCSHNL